MKVTFAALLLSTSLFAQNISQENLSLLIKEFKQTRHMNESEIMQELKLKREHKFNSKQFKLANPYFPVTIVGEGSVQLKDPINGQTEYEINQDKTVTFFHQKAVFDWYNLAPESKRNSEVCGLQFIDQSKKDYKLKTFSSRGEAESAGYMVTHRYHCGACSSLIDLAAYLEKRDLVTDGRKCALKKSLAASKKCHIKLMGLSPICAEAWAYSAMATKKRCRKTCLQEYGLINALLRKFPESRVNEDGTLKPCILCDELKSGGSFRYSSGRSRRSSGITSSIKRDENEIYFIDYNIYLDLFEISLDNFEYIDQKKENYLN